MCLYLAALTLSLLASQDKRQADTELPKDLYESRLAKKEEWLLRGGGSEKTEAAVLAALRWLARHQSEDGSWKTTKYVEKCLTHPNYREGGNCSPNPGLPDNDVGNTGLALLAFLGAGYSHLSRDKYDGIHFGDVIRKGIQHLWFRQKKDGSIGPKESGKVMYNHAIATAALVEAHGVSRSHMLKDPAEKAVRYLLAARNPGKAWRYKPGDGENDTSVTGWAATALIEARRCGFKVPNAAFQGIDAWLREVSDEKGRVGYDKKGTGLVVIPGDSNVWTHHETMSAVAVLLLRRMETATAPWPFEAAMKPILADPPEWESTKLDFYYWYFASLALYEEFGPEGQLWKAWNEKLKTALVSNQNSSTTGSKEGSWEAVSRWATEGGRVYVTALGAMALETYYRYEPIPRKDK